MSPSKRSNIGRKTRQSKRSATSRSAESDDERESRLNTERQRLSRSRSNRSEEEREQQNSQDRLRMRHNREVHNRSNDDSNERNQRVVLSRNNLVGSAFTYDRTFDYSSHRFVAIGAMNHVCEHCRSIKFKNETPGLCCASGKVTLEALNPPPDILRALVSGESSESRHFLDKIQTYNCLFQMTSFGATNIIRGNFMPTFKVISSDSLMNVNAFANIGNYLDSTSFHSSCDIQIQGQIYHKAGSLLPNPDADFQFLQIYFMGNQQEEVSRRCDIGTNIRRHIVERLQDMLHKENQLIKLFKIALDRMPSDNHKIIIRADKTPAGQHAGRYNPPTINEVAIVIVGEGFHPRDIVLHRRNNELQRVSETHRSYDALQYPLLFWQGEDGYQFNLKMRNPSGNLIK